MLIYKPVSLGLLDLKLTCQTQGLLCKACKYPGHQTFAFLRSLSSTGRPRKKNKQERIEVRVAVPSSNMPNIKANKSH